MRVLRRDLGWTFVVSGVVLGGCAGPAPGPSPAPGGDLRLAFSCPQAGLQTVMERANGTRVRTKWLGAEAGDDVLCRSENGSGVKQRSRLFGRWDVADPKIGGTTEERNAHRVAMSALLNGQSTTAGFILRGRTGEQTSQQWRVVGTEPLVIGTRTVETLRISNSYIYGGTGYNFNSELWFAPKYNLFVKSRGSLDMDQSSSWKIVRIREPGERAAAERSED